MNFKEILKQIAEGWVQATNEQFTNHPIANLIRQDLIEAVKGTLDSENDNFLIKSSAGAGNWANVPWLSILNPSITHSTQSGIYPVYLFRADGSGVYLSLCFGTTDLKKKYGTNDAKIKAAELRDNLRSHDSRLHNWQEKIELRSNTTLGKSYEWASAGAKFYPVEAIPEDQELYDDLHELLKIYSNVKSSAQVNTLRLANTAACNPISKPFLLLAGISGTGKTRFVREQAKATGSLNDSYCLISVRPDWHEPSDLLGYISRLNGPAEYITTDVLQFIAKAWRALLDTGLDLQVESTDGQGERLVVSGSRDTLNAVPYWLCLDEMNLAPVEQYFADYLSVLETREWHWADEVFTYVCDPLLKAATIEQVADKSALRQALGFEGVNYDTVWAQFCEHGLGIPLNLIVAGTVNMDETTHGFSRKVIDRALSFDFGEFFPNDFDQFFAPNAQNKALSFPIYSQATLDDLPAIDADGHKSIGFLTEVNQVLDNTPFKLAYRALNELLLAVISQNPQDELTLQAIWDDFLMCKVLPRIEGDSDKLGSAPTLLEGLTQLLQDQFAAFWDQPNNAETARPDLYREKADSHKVIRIACRSKAKLDWMQQRLVNAGFTSFWP